MDLISFETVVVECRIAAKTKISLTDVAYPLLQLVVDIVNYVIRI